MSGPWQSELGSDSWVHACERDCNQTTDFASRERHSWPIASALAGPLARDVGTVAGPRGLAEEVFRCHKGYSHPLVPDANFDYFASDFQLQAMDFSHVALVALLCGLTGPSTIGATAIFLWGGTSATWPKCSSAPIIKISSL